MYSTTSGPITVCLQNKQRDWGCHTQYGQHCCQKTTHATRHATLCVSSISGVLLLLQCGVSTVMQVVPLKTIPPPVLVAHYKTCLFCVIIGASFFVGKIQASGRSNSLVRVKIKQNVFVLYTYSVIFYSHYTVQSVALFRKGSTFAAR